MWAICGVSAYVSEGSNQQKYVLLRMEEQKVERTMPLFLYNPLWYTVRDSMAFTLKPKCLFSNNL